MEKSNIIYWNPDEKIEITGKELATFFSLIELQEKNLNEVPIKIMSILFNMAEESKKSILDRMQNEGKLSNEPI